jgi:hypothetical protein
LKREIDEKGSNFGNLSNYSKEIANLEQLKRERKNLENAIDRHNYSLKI